MMRHEHMGDGQITDLTVPSAGTFVEAETRKVCGNGHALGWRPWYRTRVNILGHCLCGAPCRLEKRGPVPLDRRALQAAGDWIAIEFQGIVPRARTEDIARVVVRAYINEVADSGTPSEGDL
jgi:hypothetical protein